MSKFAKFLLASTSLCPLLFIVSINQFERYRSVKSGIGWLAATITFVILCLWLLRHFSKRNK